MGLASWIRSFFGTFNDRFLSEARSIVKNINALEEFFEEREDSFFAQFTQELKMKVAGGQSLDAVLPEAFAAVREASKRRLNLRHFDEQLIGGIALHRGMIAEMKTGEGKTLVVSLAAYLNSLACKGVHVATVNDYLANRDVNWMKPIYNILGVSAMCITTNSGIEHRKMAYASDITYGVGSEFGFDYLRDSIANDVNEIVRTRPLTYAVIDEVDNNLIDEARTPLIISTPSYGQSSLYSLSDSIVKSLEPQHYEINESDHSAVITEEGYEYLENFVVGNKLIDSNSSLYFPENLMLMHAINQSLRANHLMMKDKEYVIMDDEIKIVHELTGRVSTGRRFSDGLHQALEAKEGLKIRGEYRAIASITLPCYYKMYQKMCGTSGTVLTERNEFGSVYGVDVCEIPTHRPIRRIDCDDAIYVTAKERDEALISLVKERHADGQPILIGVTSVEQSEQLSELLRENKLPHNVLNAKNHAKEAAIIAEAGAFGAITIATSMAGRGTDIKLGGSGGVMWSSSSEDQELIKDVMRKSRDKVVEVGGLLVLGAGRHQSVRIDNQLRGRSGRQGDIGRSKFFISLEDDLMKNLGSDRMKTILQSIGGLKSGEAMEHPWITKTIFKAQKKLELRNFEVRKTLHEFDQVLSKQRQIAFGIRAEILLSNPDQMRMIILGFISYVNKSIEERIKDNKNEHLHSLSSDFISVDAYGMTKQECVTSFYEEDGGNFDSKCAAIVFSGINHLDLESQSQIVKRVCLAHIDAAWLKYLEAVDEIKIGVSGSAQASNRDPISEFKRKTLKLFGDFLLETRCSILGNLSKLKIDCSQQEF